ncbi:monooxygenase [Verticillium alfalfae VaMs.102]|uniref:Monooxygenase n=1 Tax=Verticillium alfalfae (strain VaMs.102 / ATCC MYA-4576 / FGSC 10136) TaxID=526221 RepID=C9SAE5_VERA1|nr:monooxygenase [Verticillium alfalfae VaMs.102]EEY16313.1 monooxygenase [Verticillium alfalfae VaMs.102]
MGDAIEPEAQPNAETALDFAAVQARYAQEKAKRLHPEGVEQYVELTSSNKLQSLASDPWVDHDALNAEPPSLRNGDDIKVLILGAGYGGLLYAIHFIQQGISPSDIRLRGTRTCRFSRRRARYLSTAFSYGPELLDYAGVLADKWDLRDKGVSRSTVQKLRLGRRPRAVESPRSGRAGGLGAGRRGDDGASTGFRSPAAGLGEPGTASNMTIRGRDGRLLADKWEAQGPSTLHGVLTNGFPNLFLSGPMQTGASANFSHVQNVLAEHCSYILGEAVRRAAARGLAADRVVVEATVEAEETWASRLMQRAAWFAGAGICAPSLNNNEGSLGADPASHMKMARGAPFALGMNAYSREIRLWREEGTMKGVDVS